MSRVKAMDLTKGPILKSLIIFALPIIGINVLQSLFHAADVAVLGIFSNDNAVGSVGATTSITNLFIGFATGLATGTNVLVGRAIGAKDPEKAKRYIGTSFCISLFFGLALMVIVLVGAPYFLTWMNCPSAILDGAVLYMRVYFIGVPIILFYNFSAAIMRAVGDTLRPFIFLVVGGVVNIVLNVFFVVVLKIDVAGVAIATVVSKGITGVLSVIVLCKGVGTVKFERKYFKFYKGEMKEIFLLGIPGGLNTCLFSLSNVLLNSTLNTLGESVITGNTIAHEVDQIISNVMSGFTLGGLSFFSQNLGAKNYRRVNKVLWTAFTFCMTAGFAVGLIIFLLGRFIFGLMTDSREVIDYAMTRLGVMALTHCLSGGMNIFAHLLRSMKRPIISMVCSMFFTIGLRILWIYIVFPLNPTLFNYYVIYPISWLLCAFTLAVIALPLLRKLRIKHESEESKQEKAVA